MYGRKRLLARFDGARRADTGAGAAVQADVRIDAVDIAFIDSTGRALALAGSACNAHVRIDLVSHSLSLLNCRCSDKTVCKNMPIKWKYQVLTVNFRFWDDICKSNTNMKKILTILALACSLIASAQVKTDGSKTRIDGVIELDKTVHDFGDIMVSDGPQHCSFTVTNISGAPIAINKVVSSCGCTDV
jgi:hypothetical protein